jgi:DNA-binding CsgD family transcriptional regulator
MMPANSKTLGMIDCIYRAASEPSHWSEFADRLSDVYDGAAVVIGMALAGPASTHHYFAAGLPAATGPSLMASFIDGLPFEPAQLPMVTDRFETMGKLFPDVVLENTAFFREWIEPHGLSPVWPISYVMTLKGEQAPVILNVFRKYGRAEFTPEELALGDDLVPHFARSFEIYEQLSFLHRSRRALDNVIDRLRIGVILTDAARRPVLMNRSARMMIELGETIDLISGRVSASLTSDNELLQSTIAVATTSGASHAIRIGDDSPPKRGLQVLVNPLKPATPGSDVRDAVAALFLSGPDTFSSLSSRYLRRVCGLTAAEAELVSKLAAGASLENAAKVRGVTLNTARSQLKRAFAKTGTHGQSDIVQLVLSSISSVGEV